MIQLHATHSTNPLTIVSEQQGLLPTTTRTPPPYQVLLAPPESQKFAFCCVDPCLHLASKHLLFIMTVASQATEWHSAALLPI